MLHARHERPASAPSDAAALAAGRWPTLGRLPVGLPARDGRARGLAVQGREPQRRLVEELHGHHEEHVRHPRRAAAGLLSNEQTYAASFAPISYGMSNWGSRNPAWNDPTPTSTGSPPAARRGRSRRSGRSGCSRSSVQDERPQPGRVRRGREHHEPAQHLGARPRRPAPSSCRSRPGTTTPRAPTSRRRPSTAARCLDLSAYYADLVQDRRGAGRHPRHRLPHPPHPDRRGAADATRRPG